MIGPRVNVASLAVKGVKLYMSGEEVETMLGSERPFGVARGAETVDVSRHYCIRDMDMTRTPEHLCLNKMFVTTKAFRMSIAFTEDYPAHPGRSLVTRVDFAIVSRRRGDRDAFARSVIKVYGKPTCSSTNGYAWLGGSCADTLAFPSGPMLEMLPLEGALALSDDRFAEIVRDITRKRDALR